jgi:hypothetical protein
MLPCPYFLDGSCKFSEEQCHFSHGALVPFTTIQEYKYYIFIPYNYIFMYIYISFKYFVLENQIGQV